MIKHLEEIYMLPDHLEIKFNHIFGKYCMQMTTITGNASPINLRYELRIVVSKLSSYYYHKLNYISENQKRNDIYRVKFITWLKDYAKEICLEDNAIDIFLI